MRDSSSLAHAGHSKVREEFREKILKFSGSHSWARDARNILLFVVSFVVLANGQFTSSIICWDHPNFLSA